MADAAKKKEPGAETKTPPVRRRREPIIPPGEELAGNFEIVDVIGEGGMAVVYKARQKSLNRTVAVKVLHSRYVRDPEFVERFEAESGALANLQHPNVVNIIDRGSDNDRYFFIMECIEGDTLDQRIIDNTLSLADWRTVVTACREAFDYVHKHGFVHRDIKPSNILIGPDFMVKISDFGIAQIVAGDEEAPSQDDSASGRKARALGTQNYMAPEQITDPAAVDHRADIYSLAVTFYKMFARQMPNDEYPAPSEANHAVPVAVDGVLAKAMAEDPKDRFQTVREFCDALLAALKEQTVSITSVLNYRNSPTPATSLYTGADFRRDAPGKPKEKSRPSSAATPKPGKGKMTPHPNRSFMTPSPRGKPGAGSSLMTSTPSPGKALTPAPVSKTPKAARAASNPDGQADDATPEQNRGGGMKVVGIVVLLLIAGGAVAAFMMMNQEQERPEVPGQVMDPNVPISEQQDRLRDEILRERGAFTPQDPAEAGADEEVPESANETATRQDAPGESAVEASEEPAPDETSQEAGAAPES